jgi:hypothetical protein
MKAIKTFRDLLTFLHAIPFGKTENFAVITAEAVLRFPRIVGFIRVVGIWLVVLVFVAGALLL